MSVRSYAGSPFQQVSLLPVSNPQQPNSTATPTPTPHANPKYPPTRYSIHAVTFAMLDLLLWFGGLMDKKQKQARQ
jgi:hypothetical protein